MDLGIRPDKTTTIGADCTKTGNKKGSERFDALKKITLSLEFCLAFSLLGWS